MATVTKTYKLYKSRYESNRWKVIYPGQECFHPDFFLVYDVEHLDNGDVRYYGHPIPPVGH